MQTIDHYYRLFPETAMELEMGTCAECGADVFIRPYTISSLWDKGEHPNIIFEEIVNSAYLIKHVYQYRCGHCKRNAVILSNLHTEFSHGQRISGDDLFFNDAFTGWSVFFHDVLFTFGESLIFLDSHLARVQALFHDYYERDWQRHWPRRRIQEENFSRLILFKDPWSDRKVELVRTTPWAIEGLPEFLVIRWMKTSLQIYKDEPYSRARFQAFWFPKEQYPFFTNHCRPREFQIDFYGEGHIHFKEIFRREDSTEVVADLF